jgi:hypothetical protein
MLLQLPIDSAPLEVQRILDECEQKPSFVLLPPGYWVTLDPPEDQTPEYVI